MFNKTIKTSVIISLLSPVVMACAPSGNYNQINNNDCPVVIDLDFSGIPTPPANISSLGVTQGTIHPSLINPFNSIDSPGVLASSGNSEMVAFDFTVAAGSTINLEGIQLDGFWTTEGQASASWDKFKISMTVNGVQVASSNDFLGYKGSSTSNSNAFWEFAGSAINTDTNGTYTVNGGDLVSIAIMENKNGTPPTNGSNIFAVNGVQIHGCVVPEPTSVLLLSVGTLGLLSRRNR